MVSLVRQGGKGLAGAEVGSKAGPQAVVRLGGLEAAFGLGRMAKKRVHPVPSSRELSHSLFNPKT